MYCMNCGAALPNGSASPARRVCPVCKYIFYHNPSPCVSVLVVSEDRVLLGQRGASSIRPGLWCLPCGHIEGRETFVAAGRREVREETGLEICPLSIVNVVSNHFPGPLHSLVVVLLATPLSAGLRAGDDLVSAGWFPLDGPYPALAFQADLHIISQYRRLGHTLGIPLGDTEIEFTEDGGAPSL